MLMRRSARIWSIALAAGLLTGCVERRYVVTSDPPGAFVLRNNDPIGATPADDHFIYYGKYHFTLIKDGYATLQVSEPISTPWYEYFPLDFISEALVPWKIDDVRRFHYQLTPLEQPNLDEILQHGQELRNRGNAIGPPAPLPELPPPRPVTPPTPDDELPAPTPLNGPAVSPDSVAPASGS
jgi:hypothetical protein